MRLRGWVLLAFAALARADAAQIPPAAAPFTVFLDAAHGGPETGTLLSPQLAEKDLVLLLSIHLRSVLTARGMRVVTTREGDTTIAPETRAAEANHAHAAACLVLHATANGSGVHLYTSSLKEAPLSPTSGLLSWSNAGASFITAGLQLASALSGALDGAGIPYTLGRVRLPAMDSMRCPTVTVEVAPLHAVRSGNRQSSAGLDDTDYQARLVDALAAALLQWRTEREGAVR